MSVSSTTDTTFDTDVLNSDIPVLVDFWAEWCGPCRAVAPVLDELSDEFSGRVRIVKVNIDENPDAPVKHGVRSIPTLMLFKNGQVYETQVGALPKSALSDWLNRAV